jgi:hypothetical protein
MSSDASRFSPRGQRETTAAKARAASSYFASR